MEHHDVNFPALQSLRLEEVTARVEHLRIFLLKL